MQFWVTFCLNETALSKANCVGTLRSFNVSLYGSLRTSQILSHFVVYGLLGCEGASERLRHVLVLILVLVLVGCLAYIAKSAYQS